MENIRPSSDLRNKYNEMSSLCKTSKEPIYITVNGHGDTVLLNLELYKQMVAELELLRTLSEAENDVQKGNIAPATKTFEAIKKKLG